MTINILPSVCALDCPDTCSLSIGVDGAGRVVSLGGDPRHPITKGFACNKTARYPERRESPERIVQPQRRCGGKGDGRFETVSWDDALDEIAQRSAAVLRNRGPRSILPFSYGGTLGQIQGNHPLTFFRTLGAIEQDQTMCSTTGGAGWERVYGPNKLATPPEMIPHAGLIILWGINAARSHSHLIPWIKQAAKNGAPVIHIDPYENETTRIAQHHVAPRVGSDAALALFLGRELIRRQRVDADFVQKHTSGYPAYVSACDRWTIEKTADRCDLPTEQLRWLADTLCTHDPMYVRVGYGMTRNEGGGNAIQAIASLPAISGAWCRDGGGGGISTSGGFPWNKDHAAGKHRLRPDARRVNQCELGSELNRSDDPIDAMFVFNSNPAVVAPDSAAVRRGLMREDLLLVVLEHFQTDTAKYADFILPATTFLEHADIYAAYGHYHVQWAQPVVPPRGETKPNTWVFAELAKRLKLDEPSLFWDAETIAASLLDSDGFRAAGITWEALRQQRSMPLHPEGVFHPYADGSSYADRKIRLGDPPPVQLEFKETLTAEFPLRLISPPGSHTVNSTMGNDARLKKGRGGRPEILLHPDDAASAGVADGELAEIRSRIGSIRRWVRVTKKARRETAIAVGLWWDRDCPDGKGLNEITSQRLTDLGGGSTYGNVAVGVIPLSDHASANGCT